SPEQWTSGNMALFRYYDGRANPMPETPAEMSALYPAVMHGCEADLQQSTYSDILLPRVWHGRRESFSTRKLGMTGADLAALSHFSEPHHWDRLRAMSLTQEARVLILTNAAVRLRALGRLDNAREAFRAVMETIDAETSGATAFEDAAYAAAQNSELLVIAG